MRQKSPCERAEPFVYHHYYYSFHRENLCCSSSCQEQVFTRQPVTRVAPGGKRRSGEAFCVELRFSLRVRLKWRERHQLLTLLLLPFCLTFLFFWHWFERKNINKTNLKKKKKSGWNVFLFSHTFILDRIIRLFVASNGKLDDRYSSVISV